MGHINSSQKSYHGCIPNTQNWVFFFYFPKYSIVVAIISQPVKKRQQWFLYEVIEDILRLVLNKKRPLSTIWLLSY